MIDHSIMIGGQDVSKHVLSFRSKAEVGGESIGTASVVLINPGSMYNQMFHPVFHYMTAYLINNKGTVFKCFTGTVSDSVAHPEDGTIEVTAECVIAELSDFITKTRVFDEDKTSAQQILLDICSMKSPPPVIMFNDVEDREIHGTAYDGTWTYNSVIADIAKLLGAVAFTDESGVIQFQHIGHFAGTYDVSNCCESPMVATSIAGYCSRVTCIGYSNLDKNDAYTTPDGTSWTVVLDDPNRPEMASRPIKAPTLYFYNVKDKATLEEIAGGILSEYTSKRDTFTQCRIQGIVPGIRSMVKFIQFQDIKDRGSAVTLYGIVMAREIQYSPQDGILVTVDLHPEEDQVYAQELFEQPGEIVGEPIPTPAEADKPPGEREDSWSNGVMDWINNRLS